MNVGDRVKVHTGATSEFVIVSIDGGDAVIESVRDDVPGRFPFPCRLDRAVIIAADAALVAARPLPEMRFSDAELIALLERYSHVRARVLRY